MLLIGALLIILTSCGGNKSGPASLSIAPNDRGQSVATDQSIQQVLAKSELECGIAGECPEGLGLLVGIENGRAYRCSAFVLENGLIYSNAHCVPQEIQGLKGESCKNHLGFVFKVNNVTHKIGCDEIVTSTDLASEGPGIQDVAVMRARIPSNLKRFKSTLRSRYAGEAVSIYRVNPKGNWNGEVVKSSCSLKMNTFFGEFFDGPQSPAINTLGCETVAGNSGSPVVDKNGLVLGIHQSSLKDKSELGQKLISHFKANAFSSLGTATNLSCLCEEHGVKQSCSQLPKSCTDLEFAGSDRRRSVIVEKEIYKRVGGAAAGILTKHGSDLPAFIRWEVAYGHRLNTQESEDALRINLMVAPRCLESTSAFKSELEKNESELRETTHTIEFMAPHCQVNFEFNGLFDFNQVGIDESSCKSARMVLYLRKENSQWEGEAQYVDDSLSSLERPYAYNFKLPACS